MILTVPGGRLQEFMEAFERRFQRGGFSKRLFEFNLDFPHPPFYNTLFDMWGLDNYGTTWDV